MYKFFYKNSLKVFSLLTVIIIFAFIVLGQTRLTSAFTSPLPVDLSTAGHYAILAGSAITGTGTNSVTGDAGLSPTTGSAITLLTCSEMTGTSKIYDTDAGYVGGGNPDVTCLITDLAGLATSKTNFASAYTDAAGRIVDATIATDLGAQSLTTGVYDSASGTFSNSGTLTLDAQGNPDNVFIFKMATTLITSASSTVVLTNGAKASNVFWVVGSSATLGSSSILMGNIMAVTSITVGTNANVYGRLLADADNNTNGFVTLDGGNTVILDTTAPTVTITDDEVGTANIANGDVVFTFTFSEPVYGFTVSDVVVTNGTKAGAFASGADGSTVFTLAVTPDSDSTTSITVDVATNVAVDTSGNGNTIATQAVQTVDTIRPTVGIVVTDTALKNGETSLVTFTFNEAVTGFDNTDLTAIENGGLSAVSSGDGGITWTATFTPTDNIEDALNVITIDKSGIADVAGNAGSGSTSSNNYEIDTLEPTVVVTMGSATFKNGDTTLVTFTFSEAPTGFTTDDVTVGSGAIGVIDVTNPLVQTATYTPTDNVEVGTNVISVGTGWTDVALNTPLAGDDSPNYTVDTLEPTLVSAIFTDDALKIGETSLVTFLFSEAVTGFTNTDLTIENGTFGGAVSSIDGGTTWTATFTPSVGIEDSTNVITIDMTGVADAVNNSGVGTANSSNYAIDTIRPTVGTVVTDTALKNGETSLVTFTFNEAVTGFANDDLTIENGTFGGAVSSSDGGITWTATFTPTDNIEDALNVITIDKSGIADVAGNAGSGSTSSNNYEIDTLEPTVVVTMGSAVFKNGDTTLVTFTFSEAPTGFTTDDVTVGSGAIGVIDVTNPLVQTATYTPTDNVEVGTNVISVGTGWTDVALNTPLAGDDSPNYTVDTLEPTVTSITFDDSAIIIGDTPTITIVMSEPVTSFDNTDVTTPNGSLGALTSGDNITFTGTFTPNAVQDNTNLAVVATTFTDTAGNIASAGATSANYTIETIAPTITSITTQDRSGNGQIDHLIFTMSENLNDNFAGIAITISTGHGLTAFVTGTTALDNIFEANLIESGTSDTDAVPTVSVDTSTTLGDPSGNIMPTTGGIVSVDGSAPVIISTTPVASAVGQSRTQSLIVTFSEPMNTATVTITDNDAGTNDANYTQTWSNVNKISTSTHDIWSANTNVTITFSGNEISAPGLAIVGATTLSFTTVGYGGSGSGNGIPTGAINITQGDTTDTREITIDSTYSANAIEMIISENPDFIGDSFQPTTSSVPFTLSENYGLKTVYIMYRSLNGLSPIYSDTIEYYIAVTPEELTTVQPAPVITEPSPIVSCQITSTDPKTGLSVDYCDPTNTIAFMVGMNVTHNDVCESQYRSLLIKDNNEFNVYFDDAQLDASVNFVCYGISTATVALGAGERRAQLRDYMQITGYTTVYWDDIARNAVGQKIVHRNLALEALQVPATLEIFVKLFGRIPNFKILKEDMTWNTLLYRIRFPRDLVLEREGITKFREIFKHTPITPLEWSTVRALGYIK